MANHENEQDPVLQAIEKLMATLAGQLGTEALQEAVTYSEIPQLPPTSPNDMRWESWHKGGVDLLDYTNAIGLGEVIKVYRAPESEERYLLHRPSGPPIQMGSSDIVQIYPRDTNGRLQEQPTFVFQAPDHIPKGYRLTPDLSEAKFIMSSSPSDDDRQEDEDYEDTTQRSIIVPGPKPPLGERWWTDSGRLRSLSNRIHGKPDKNMLWYPSGGHTTVVLYPLFGKPLNVVTPNGWLIKGRKHDVVEIVRDYPDGSHSTLRRTTLAKLSEEERHMVIDIAEAGQRQ